MDKMKTNQDGGSVTAKDSSAAGKQLEKNQAKEGAAKYKGAHDYDTSKGSHDHPHGAARMGYSQSFGAARINGYAKGAAKVANIMSFGASKYMKHGAADTGHGGPEGHTHPTMTLKSRTTSGGGSTSSSSNTTGGDNSSSSNSSSGSSSSGRTSFSSDPVEKAKQKEWIKNNPVKYKQMLAEKNNQNSSGVTQANVTSSNSSSNTTNSGSSTNNEEIITSPLSMAETMLQGNIADENRSQTFNFNRNVANINAGNDSIAKRNSYLDNLKNESFAMSDKAQFNASRLGGQEAARTRINSDLFSAAEVRAMYQDGQKKNSRGN